MLLYTFHNLPVTTLCILSRWEDCVQEERKGGVFLLHLHRQQESDMRYRLEFGCGRGDETERVLDQQSMWGGCGRLRGALATVSTLLLTHVPPPYVHTSEDIPIKLAVEHFLNPNSATSIVTSYMIWGRFSCAPALTVGGKWPVPRLLHILIVSKLI